MPETLLEFDNLPVDGKLGRIYQKLIDKCQADDERFTDIYDTLNDHESRINKFELIKSKDEGAQDAKAGFLEAWRWLLGPLISGAIIGFLVVFGQFYLHLLG
jgi:hypothetical protein